MPAILDKFGSKHPVNKEIVGANTGQMWAVERFGGPEVVSRYLDVGLKLARLPGGTPANFYLWRTPTHGSNRVPSSELNPSEAQRISDFNTALTRPGRTYSVDDFLHFLTRTSTEFTYVVNVLHETPEETGALMRKFKDAGVEVKNIELGNELHFESGYLQQESDRPKEYLELSDAHYFAVRAVFPAVKAALLSTTRSYRDPSFLTGGRQPLNYAKDEAWDLAVASSRYADALVAHWYTPFDVELVQGLPEDQRAESVFRQTLQYAETRLRPAIDYYEEIAPGKDLWVTEWNVSFWGIRELEPVFINSFFQALYCANVLTTFLTSPQVTKANYHNFLYFERGAASASQAFKMFSLFVDEVSSAQFVTSDSHPEIVAVTGLNSKGKSRTIVMNNSASDRMFDATSLIGAPKVMSETIANDPARSLGYRTYRSLRDPSNLYAPAYSMTYLAEEEAAAGLFLG